MHYWRVAETFARSGLIALDFDPRFVGASVGQPRQRWSPAGLREDLQAAVDLLRTVPGVDRSKVALYGSSTGGGAAIDVAASDPSIAALVCVVPVVDGPTNFPGLPMGQRLWLLRQALRDLISRPLGRPQVTVRAVSEDGSGGAAVDRDGAVAAFEVEVQPGGTWSSDHESYTTDESVWINTVAPWDLVKWLTYRPGKKLSKLACPTLLISGDRDTVTPPGPQRRLASSNPKIDVLTGPWNHFDVFRSDRAFDEIATRMMEFLKGALP
jgi:pimeloyl-ACP methyl ester carboxylesterase